MSKTSTRRERDPNARKRHVEWMEREEGKLLSQNAGVKEALAGVDDKFGLQSMLSFLSGMNGLFAYGVVRMMPKMDQSKLTMCLASVPRDKDIVLKPVAAFWGLPWVSFFLLCSFLDYAWKPEVGDVYIPDGTLNMMCMIMIAIRSIWTFEWPYKMYRKSCRIFRKGSKPLKPYWKKMHKIEWWVPSSLHATFGIVSVTKVKVVKEKKTTEPTATGIDNSSANVKLSRRNARKMKKEVSIATAASAAATQSTTNSTISINDLNNIDGGYYYFNTSTFTNETANAGAVVGFQWFYFIIHYLMVYPFAANIWMQLVSFLMLHASFQVVWIFNNTTLLLQHHIWILLTLAIHSITMNIYLPNTSVAALQVTIASCIIWLLYSAVIRNKNHTIKEDVATPLTSVPPSITEIGANVEIVDEVNEVQESSPQESSPQESLQQESVVIDKVEKNSEQQQVEIASDQNKSTPKSDKDKDKDAHKYSISYFPWWIGTLPVPFVVGYIVIHLSLTLFWTCQVFPMPMAFILLMTIPPLQLFYTTARAKILLWRWYLFVAASTIYWIALILLARMNSKLRIDERYKTMAVSILFTVVSMSYGFFGFIFPIASLIRKKLKMCMKTEFKGHGLFSSIDKKKTSTQSVKETNVSSKQNDSDRDSDDSDNSDSDDDYDSDKEDRQETTKKNK